MKSSLPSSEREFLRLVSHAAFANPFSEDRRKLDLAIAGLSRGASEEEILIAALARIRGSLERIEAGGKTTLNAYPEADRTLLRHAHLFDLFHRFADEFDRLIQSQIRQEGAACPVPFAEEATGLMRARGFADKEACRNLAMFYQLRRAYYFIDFSLVGKSPSMRQLRLSLWNSVFTHDMTLYERHLWNRMEDFSTLLLGETGTGKGAAAKAIGMSGHIPFDPRTQRFTESFMQSFLPINISQFPESLIESELFGHRKGAFTGAVEAHKGVFSRCSPHGSIFLDEIGEVSVPIQIKLLQVLQERVFSPVGSHEKTRFQGRVIAATNRPLSELRGGKRLRDDFFYRLCSDIIVVPPLRQRIRETPGEFDDLLELTVRRIVGDPAPEVLDVVRDAIRADPGEHYSWPGNVRELEQCVRRLLLTRRYAPQTAEETMDLQARLHHGIDAGSFRANELLAAYCGLLYRRSGSYERVARLTGLDRRTVKKHILAAAGGLMVDG